MQRRAVPSCLSCEDAQQDKQVWDHYQSGAYLSLERSVGRYQCCQHGDLTAAYECSCPMHSGEV